MKKGLTKTSSDRKGLLLGFKKLDKAIVGLKPGQVMVFSSYPGVGKTAFALKVIENLALE